MIVVSLLGRLGNQMFQYAAGRHLSLQHGAELVLDISAVRAGRDTWGYALAPFNVAARLESCGAARRAMWRCLQPLRSHRRDGIPLYVAQSPLRMKLPLFARRAEFAYGDWFHSLPDHVFLHGYWQSEKFFPGRAEVLRRDFALTDMAPIAEKAARLRAADDIVAVHVRRGDYLGSERFCVLGETYFRNAMAHFGNGCNFLVFTDDLGWCREHLRGDNVEIAGQRDSVHDLTLMSKCTHNIISNSTFSWWAAWLNDNPGKQVVAPRPWFDPDYRTDDEHDVIPEGWTVIDGLPG